MDPRHVRITGALFGAALFGMAMIGFVSVPSRHFPTREITVSGTDYSFSGVPTTLSPGRLFIAFRNDGRVRHEMAIARIKAGVPAEDAIAAMKNGGRRRDFVDGAAVLIVAAPGEESSRARVVLDVRKGEVYLVSCTLKDSPDSPPHIMLGMYTSFRVR